MAKQTKTARQWCEALETRQMLSAANPTDFEQYVIELINRARANPAAEAKRLGIDLNEGLPAGTISGAARQPVAVNPYLTEAARDHSQWMIDKDTFSHTGAGGSKPGDRMKSAGYAFVAPWTWAENIALRSFKSTNPHADVFEAIERDLFVDIGIADRGHRLNMLSAASKEIGVGAVAGQYSYFRAAAVTEDFASSGESTFLTGVVYTDGVTKDQFYTPGEGLGGVSVTATRLSDGATFKTQSWSAGGYSLKLAAGTYKVVASGGALGKTVTYDSVTIGQENVKRDFTPATNPTPTPPPPTKPPTPKPPTPKPPTPKPPTPKPPTPKPPTPKPPTTLPDTAAPAAKVTQALRKRQVSRYYRFTITYTDNINVLTSSLGTGDVQVRGAGGYARIANFVSADNSANGKARTATYEVKGPKGVWNRSHNGLYTIWVIANQVKDPSGNFISGQRIGAFTARVPKGASATPVPPTGSPFAKKSVKRSAADLE